MDIRNKRLTDEEFYKQRQEVLAQWHTGKDVDLDEAAEAGYEIQDEDDVFGDLLSDDDGDQL